MLRLQKLLARAGVAARRDSEQLIREGRVRVNGAVVTELGRQVDPERDRVEVDGRPVRLPALVYLALHKPVGYVSSAQDERGRPSVLRLAPPAPGLHPVGRLDVDTSGLLLLTNDGDFTFRLTHPRHEVPKTYRAAVRGTPTAATLARLQAGISLEEVVTAPAQARLLGPAPGGALVELVIHEGRKRQVRRMLAAVGHRVVELVRLAVGPVSLGALPPGRVRALTAEEVAGLLAAAGSVKQASRGDDTEGAGGA